MTWKGPTVIVGKQQNNTLVKIEAYQTPVGIGRDKHSLFYALVWYGMVLWQVLDGQSLVRRKHNQFQQNVCQNLN